MTLFIISTESNISLAIFYLMQCPLIFTLRFPGFDMTMLLLQIMYQFLSMYRFLLNVSRYPAVGKSFQKPRYVGDWTTMILLSTLVLTLHARFLLKMM